MCYHLNNLWIVLYKPSTDGLINHDFLQRIISHVPNVKIWLALAKCKIILKVTGNNNIGPWVEQKLLVVEDRSIVRPICSSVNVTQLFMTLYRCHTAHVL